jgi:hypothetical protein
MPKHAVVPNNALNEVSGKVELKPLVSRPKSALPVQKQPVLHTVPRPKPKMRKVITSEVRFEFVIPENIPADNANRYMWGKMQIICRNLSKNGLKVIPLVPSEYAVKG